MLEHLPRKPLAVVMPFEAHLAAYLLAQEAARCTEKTMEHYRYTLGSFITWLHAQDVAGVAGITAHHIRTYLVSLQKRGLKDTTQHAHARGIRAWCNWLLAEGDLERSPMQRVAMPKLEARVPAPFSTEDVQRLLAVCDRHTPVGARNYALCLTLLDTGLRASECAALRLSQVDMKSGMVVVFGKGQKQRQVRIGAKARAAILRMLAYCQVAMPGDALWPAYTGDRGELTMHGMQVVLRRLGEKAGVKPSGPHRFRRTFALWCLRDGMDLHSLRMLMGHSTLAMLQRYLALAGEDVERAHVAHSPVDKLLARGR